MTKPFLLKEIYIYITGKMTKVKHFYNKKLDKNRKFDQTKATLIKIFKNRKK